VYESCGDDCGSVGVLSTDHYLCRAVEKSKSVATKAMLVYENKSFAVKLDSLYNLDSSHSNVHYLKFRKIKNKDYLFGKFGPAKCPYFVVWKRVGKEFLQKNLFEPAIEHDLYADEEYLREFLDGQ
jgi:hypothetical protein